MAQPNSPFFDEAANAIRGCVALITGKRDSSTFFDFSQRGLVGSLIAALVAILLAAFGPLVLGLALPPGTATQSVVVNGVLFLTQAGMAYIVLRQMGRQDGFIPYLVASNWVTLFSAVLLLISTVFGPVGMVLLLGIAVIALLTFINIGRFIVTLAPMQIALLFVSQAVGVFLALGLIAIFLPAPPMP
ncbi:hypothetical protein VW35_18025 [Devosia soli]|uniref:Yip1 domain-containing protein n=1 Tax=Devosia soli TaxID=361041 RepID=A0A0F5L2S8_9HYPH|nr:hypothetical protein [Devosia soli]KKB76658.1 hypothetical protein VW35_18025 [Devosia soli]